MLLALSIAPAASAQFCDPEAKQVADSLGYQVNLVYSYPDYYDLDFVLFSFQCFNGSKIGISLYLNIEEMTAYSEFGRDGNRVNIFMSDECVSMDNDLVRSCDDRELVSGAYKVVGRLDMNHHGSGGALGKLYVIKMVR